MKKNPYYEDLIVRFILKDFIHIIIPSLMEKSLEVKKI